MIKNPLRNYCWKGLGKIFFAHSHELYMCFARVKPAKVSANPSTTLMPMFAIPFPGEPLSSMRMDSREKDEKVVKPPRKPVMITNWKFRESSPRSIMPTRNPIRKQPKRFTSMVPQ